MQGDTRSFGKAERQRLIASLVSRRRIGTQNDLRAADKCTVEIREAERRLLSQQPNLEIAFTEVLEHRAPDGRRYLVVTVESQNSDARNLKA